MLYMPLKLHTTTIDLVQEDVELWYPRCHRARSAVSCGYSHHDCIIYCSQVLLYFILLYVVQSTGVKLFSSFLYVQSAQINDYTDR
jgi:hypothetical protein